ncbi:MAG: hypothetical protein HQK54_14120 [Oligoflexales bacterium]|nr:hypothetical protein [Oligoflexales bacterium]
MRIIEFFSLPLFIAAVCGGLSACRTIQEEMTVREQGISYLNERQYDKAIILFNEIVDKDPLDHEARIYLASSYAGLSKFDIIDSFEGFKDMLFPKTATPMSLIQDENKNAVPLAGTEKPYALTGGNTVLKELSGRLDDYIEDAYIALKFISKFSHPSLEERRYIDEAVMHLQKIPIESNYFLRANLYMVILYVYQSLNYFRDMFAFKLESDGKWDLKVFACSIRPAGFADNVESTVRYLVLAAQSVQNALLINPKLRYSKTISMKIYGEAFLKQFKEYSGTISAIDIITEFMQNYRCEDRQNNF